MKTKQTDAGCFVTIRIGPRMQAALLAYYALHDHEHRRHSDRDKLESAAFWTIGMALSMPNTLCRLTQSAIDYREAEGLSCSAIVEARVAGVADDWQGRLPYSDGYEDEPKE